MKIATLKHGGTTRAAKLNDAGTEAVLLKRADGTPLATLKDYILARGEAHEDGAPVAVTPAMFAAPIPLPSRNVFCVGKNYADHARELSLSGAQEDLPEYPIIFTKVPDAVIGPGDAILVDASVSTAIDYEAELAVIIGTGGRNISKADAMRHVWGYTILNDVTARDIQRRHNQWHLGKSQDTSCPMGPWAVTADALDLNNTGVRCFVNGEKRQDGNTHDFIFDIPTIIATLSFGITLKPGDIIATGTPSGVGAASNPPKFLKPGDTVRVEIDGIGALENPVAAWG
jgi:2-keto-4-pentenoate hydratase/2-oxohepta-3-ene-1,7-dioic acid hydratase in catechol pathway